MPTKLENKKQMEAILGEKISDDAIQLIKTRVPVAIYTKTPGITTHRHQLAALPNVCYANDVMDVSGFAVTGNNGQRVFKLSEFICSSGKDYNHPINVVATPYSAKPFFLTVQHSLLNNGEDVEITVFAWDANGAPAPEVYFNWRCRVEIPLRIL
jgi:hypothetical protein